MLQLTALAVSAVAQACERGVLAPGDVLDITYRRYRYDPPDVWFLEVDIAKGRSWAERTSLISA
jgi:hypothetical protein